MRIAMILDHKFPPDPRVTNEAKALIRAGHEVFLFCITRDRSLAFKEDFEGIHVFRYYITDFVRKCSILAYSFPLYKWQMGGKIKDYLTQVKPDAIHVHDMQIAETVMSVNTKFNLPITVDLHENRPEIMRFYHTVTSFPGNVLIHIPLWKKAEKRITRAADGVVMVTQLAKDELVKRAEIEESKVIVSSNSVDEDFYTDPAIDSSITERYKDKSVLLYIGDTSERRGVGTAVQAMPSILKNHPNSKLVILGKSAYDSNLKSKAKELNIEDSVDFEGWVDPSVFQSYIKASKIGISPLHINEHHNTTFANKIFQYLSLGLPILVSNVTAQEQLVDEYEVGFVHRAEDVEDFAAKANKMLDETELRLEFGRKGALLVRDKFSEEQVYKELIEYYSNLRRND